MQPCWFVKLLNYVVNCGQLIWIKLFKFFWLSVYKIILNSDLVRIEMKVSTMDFEILFEDRYNMIRALICSHLSNVRRLLSHPNIQLPERTHQERQLDLATVRPRRQVRRQRLVVIRCRLVGLADRPEGPEDADRQRLLVWQNELVDGGSIGQPVERKLSVLQNFWGYSALVFETQTI